MVKKIKLNKKYFSSLEYKLDVFFFSSTFPAHCWSIFHLTFFQLKLFLLINVLSISVFSTVGVISNQPFFIFYCFLAVDICYILHFSSWCFSTFRHFVPVNVFYLRPVVPVSVFSIRHLSHSALFLSTFCPSTFFFTVGVFTLTFCRWILWAPYNATLGGLIWYENVEGPLLYELSILPHYCRRTNMIWQFLVTTIP
jgi:hypothetical protein